MVTIILLSVLVCWLFQIPYKSDITQYLSFFVWLTLISIVAFSSIHVVPNGRIFFFPIASTSPQCIHIPNFFIYLSVDGHFGGLHILTIMDNIAIKKQSYMSSIYYFHFLWVYTQMWNCCIICQEDKTYALALLVVM